MDADVTGNVSCCDYRYYPFDRLPPFLLLLPPPEPFLWRRGQESRKKAEDRTGPSEREAARHLVQAPLQSRKRACITGSRPVCFRLHPDDSRSGHMSWTQDLAGWVIDRIWGIKSIFIRPKLFHSSKKEEERLNFGGKWGLCSWFIIETNLPEQSQVQELNYLDNFGTRNSLCLCLHYSANSND